MGIDGNHNFVFYKSSVYIENLRYKMKTVFSDLDNTLIFSHRKKGVDEKIPVEYLNGRVQSYMPEKLVKLLTDNKDIKIVPVTTRSIEQYLRLQCLNKVIHNETALVCNGGVLLIDGHIDDEWLCESIELSRVQSKEIKKILNRVQKEGKSNRIKILFDFMFYFSCNDVENYYYNLKREADLNNVFLGKDSRKIYVIASNINKGASVKRYIRRFGIKDFITAGDSEFDISMLELKSKAIASAKLENHLSNTKVTYSKCEFLFEDIHNIINNIIVEDLQ